MSMTLDQAAQFYKRGHGKQLCATRDVVMCRDSDGNEEKTTIFLIDRDLGNVVYSSWIKSVLDQGTMYDLLGQTTNEETLTNVVEMVLGFFEVTSYFQHELPLWRGVWKIKREFEQSIVRHRATSRGEREQHDWPESTTEQTFCSARDTYQRGVGHHQHDQAQAPLFPGD